MTPTLRPIAPTSGDREILTTRLAHARARTDELFALLSPDALYERPIPERHRLVFYLGHLEAFDANLLRQAYGLASFHPEFDKLFAFGIDPTDGGLPNEPPSAWPSAEAIRAYNGRVREAVDGCIGARTIRPEFDEETIIGMAIEHRLMHAETLAYLLHRLPHEMKHGRPDPPLKASAPAARAESIRIPAGRATLGLERASGRFGWDNEFEAHSVSVPEFSIDRHKVTNGRFLEFMEAGGYAEKRFWSDDDWDWKESQKLQQPAFWIRRGNEWRWRGMFAELPLELNAPVYVSLAEASAFARWAGRSLPTEAQFHRAAYGTPDGPRASESGEREYPWGDDPPASKHGNFDFQRWDPTPVGAHPAGASAFGVDEMVGNGWEWTSTPFGPFDGFRAHPLYAGYSADFFDGKHYVMKGGSPRTGACMLRRSFRNWFQPRYGYVYATFRTVAA